MLGRLPFYALGQAIGYAIDLGLFHLLVDQLGFGWPVAVNVLSKFTSAAITYFYHERFSFPGQKARSHRQSVFMYCAVVAGNMILTSIMLGAILAFSGLPPIISKIIADVIGVMVTYAAFRFLVFTRATSAR